MQDYGLKTLILNIMKLKKVLIIAIMLVSVNSFAQSAVTKRVITDIEANDGNHYITNQINYPVAGTYFFKGGEPIVELNDNGTGFYQLHEQPKRPIIWGFECSMTGEPIFTKGYDSAEYILYYQFTSGSDSETEEEWNKVEFSIHLNSMKMFINGERMKTYTAKVEK